MKFFEKAENIFASLLVLIFVFLLPPFAQINGWITSVTNIGLLIQFDAILAICAVLMIVGPLLALIAVILEFAGKSGKQLSLIAAIVTLAVYVVVVLYTLVRGGGLGLGWVEYLTIIVALGLLLSCLGVIKFKKA